MDTEVALLKCEQYELNSVKDIIRKQLELLNISPDYFKGKRIVLKPNLVNRKQPDKCVTTHPCIVEATVSLLIEYGAGEVLIAESPAGSYTENSLKGSYQASGFYESTTTLGAKFNFDCTFKEMKAENATTVKTFNVITPIIEADLIINLCKLKTHSLTALSAAAKNYFGVIPGTQKVEMHARFQNQSKFMEMLVDLAQMLMLAKPMINICDAVMGMEGNGPTNGSPKKMGFILTSRNPFALDYVASELIDLTKRVEMLTIAQRRGILPKNFEDINILGDKCSNLAVENLKVPDSHKLSYLSHLPKFLQPSPVIDKSICVGCGRCEEACPQKTIIIDKKAKIKANNCIKCFCCQELCPFNAVKIKQHFIFKLWH